MIDRQLNYGRHHIQKFITVAQPFSTVLDLGAGHGDDLLIARRIYPGAKLFAVENFDPYAEELKQKEIEVIKTNLETDALPFKNGSIDIVICNQILEHCKEVWWIFHEISRVLSKNGKLIIGVPNLASLHNRLLLLCGEQPTSIKNNSAHLRGYTKKDLLNLLDSGFPSGYILKCFGGGNFYPFPGMIAKPLSNLLPSFAWSIFLMFEKIGNYQSGFLKYPIEKRLETNFFLGPGPV